MRWVALRPGDDGAGDEASRVGVVAGERVHALEPGVALFDLLGDGVGSGTCGTGCVLEVEQLGQLRSRAVPGSAPQPLRSQERR